MFNFIKTFLFLDNNKISHTEFWSNVGYGCMSYTFTYAVLYGTVVIGNRTLKKKLEQTTNGNKDVT